MLDLRCCWNIDAIVNSCGRAMCFIFAGAILDFKHHDQGFSWERTGQCNNIQGKEPKEYTLPRFIEWAICECYCWKNYTAIFLQNERFAEGIYGSKRSTRAASQKAISLRQCTCLQQSFGQICKLRRWLICYKGEIIHGLVFIKLLIFYLVKQGVLSLLNT